MSEHQESLKQVVARIEASFVKIKSYGDKVDQFRISAGKQLVELQARIEAGEAGKSVKWWAWYAENFKNRTRRDAQRAWRWRARMIRRRPRRKSGPGIARRSRHIVSAQATPSHNLGVRLTVRRRNIG